MGAGWQGEGARGLIVDPGPVLQQAEAAAAGGERERRDAGILHATASRVAVFPASRLTWSVAPLNDVEHPEARDRPSGAGHRSADREVPRRAQHRVAEREAAGNRRGRVRAARPSEMSRAESLDEIVRLLIESDAEEDS